MRGLEKNRMKRGQTNTQTHKQTIRPLDQLGPEGRVGENKKIIITRKGSMDKQNFKKHAFLFVKTKKKKK